MRKKLDFLKIALLDRKVGALAESSEHLVKKTLKALPDRPFWKVIEYGPGSGVMTRELLRRLPEDGELTVIESNPHFTQLLRAIADPRLRIIEGEIQEIIPELADRGLRDVDLIVSSIPFSWLSRDEREEVLALSYRLLSPEGSFVVFHQYIPVVAWSLKRLFEQVKISMVLWNVFPCFVIVARKSTEDISGLFLN